ncbi:dihydropyrimidinase-related protein 2 isoform X5 [Lepeophtheirus salmonis]|uniref:dihydropyrimidinase-related protein 2 isoform X5 n=2 Tax=Lepeophtheirus salmonis TaxID=72036 RepID=UPI003AF3C188
MGNCLNIIFNYNKEHFCFSWKSEISFRRKGLDSLLFKTDVMSVMSSRRGNFYQDDEEGAIPVLGSNRSRPQSSSNILGIGDDHDKDIMRGRRIPKTTGDSSQMRAVFGLDATVASVDEAKNNESFKEASTTLTSLQSLPIFSATYENTFIKGGSIANDDGIIVGDILIRNGVIEEIGESLDIPEDSEIIDAKGKYVIPGGVDISVNLGITDDIEDGTKAALAGGTTFVMDLIVPKEDQTLTNAFDNYKNKADNESYCDYGFRVAIPQWDKNVSEEMSRLIDRGVICFKAYMSDSMSLSANEIIEFLNKVKSTGAIAQVHAENGEIIAENQKRLAAKNITGPEGHLMSRPEEVEEEAVNTLISFAKEIVVPIVISGMSGKDAIDLVAQARDTCKFIVGEPSISAMCVDGKGINNKNWSHAAGFVTSPPIREDSSTSMKLWSEAINGNLEIISSHHHTNSISIKRSNGGDQDYRNIFPGVNGIEERLSLLWEKVHWGELKIEDFVKISSSNAAKLLGIYPQKGRIEKGSDADITIINPKNIKKISSKTQTSTKSDFNIFQGMKVHGIPEVVIRGGQVVVYNYVLCQEPSIGKYIKCSPFPKYIYNHVNDYESSSKYENIERSVENNEESFLTASSNYSQPDDFGLTTPRSHSDAAPVMNTRLGIYQRPVSAHGIRNQQDSTFSLSSTNDSEKKKPGVKITAPSGGGYSRGFW